MAKTLTVTFPEKCIGCELCVIQVQKQLGKVGLDGSLIRVKRIPSENQKLQFTLEIDPHINALDIKQIKEICPTGVFTLEEGNQPDGFVL